MRRACLHQGLTLILPMYRPHQISATQAFAKRATRFGMEKRLLKIHMKLKISKNEKLTQVFLKHMHAHKFTREA
jgi:hypothetical protein